MQNFNQIINQYLLNIADFIKKVGIKNILKYNNLPVKSKQGLEYVVYTEDQQNNIIVSPDLHRPKVLSPNGKLLYHCHEYFELIYVYQGSCQCFLDGIEHTFYQNQLCIMNTDTLHTMYVYPNSVILNILISTKLFDEIFVQLMSENDSFLGFFLDSIYNRKNKSKFYIFDILTDTDCEFYLRKLIVECVQNPDKKQQVKKANFICLLYELAEQYQDFLTQTSPDKNLEFSSLIEYISQHYKTVTLQDMSNHFHYTTTSMSKYIKKQTGRTFSDILRSIRLKNSYYLLSYTNLSIEEIADKLGYHERSYFEKIFKQYCDITPAEYRKKHTTLKKFNTI
ncbi:AraC family transcriptional regulator [Massilioclostridium coli]|uniref:AraC family transcriptional regulator n=1 Tax=Massilioclostridium coli TaxID=1870991 RepID=UPI00085BC6EA|nr:helix-turn-helix domain-containing protein [Massilioclostridium coli]